MGNGEICAILDSLRMVFDRHVESLSNIRKVGITEKNVGEYMRHTEAMEWVQAEIVYYNDQLKRRIMMG